MDENFYWQAVTDRDHTADGKFVFAVRTTGVYCRPSCPSRRPFRQNVEFFPAPTQAQQAGYRACLRCQPDTDPPARVEPNLDLIVEVCRYLEEPRDGRPSLDDLAAHFALSPYHLQRTFKRITGVSPRQYADAHRHTRLKDGLKQGSNVTEAVLDAGYETSSSFYEQTETILGMKPTTYRQGGKATEINYTIVPSQLGFLLVAATERGISKISLGDDEAQLLQELKTEFPLASLRQDDQALRGWVALLLSYFEGQTVTAPALPLDIQATAFQRRVWEALRTIPYGSTRSYRQVAESVGQPTAARAVAQACAHNPVALLIPCHRVVREDGNLSGYRWGVERKRQILAQEAALSQSQTEAVV